jgi:LCP family protein required for cell wall assembly
MSDDPRQVLGGDGEGATGRPRKRRRGWAQRLVLLGGVVSSVGLAASAAGFGYVQRKAERIPRVELSSVLEEAPGESGEPQNYLIVGIDNADRLDPDDPVRRQRDSNQLSDTIMVLRIDPDERKAQLLSLPRDLWVPYDDAGDNARINTAISRGNGRPDVLIGVLRDYLGIPVHHYLQLDLLGFRDLVTAIDGVPVHFPYPARDQRSGLSILETGCVTLDPVQALAYARSRYHDQLVDGEWVRDPRYDLGRIARQQDFIRRAMDRAVSKGARNPGTLDRLLDAALASVTIDDELTTGDIFDLAQRFREFDPDSLETYTVPVERTFKGAADVVLLLENEAEPILSRFRGDPSGDGGLGEDGEGDGDDGTTGASADMVPASVRLNVLNGSGANGQAAIAAEELTGAGFIVVGRGEEPGFGIERTVVRYPEGSRAAAELVARWLEAGADLEEVPAGSGGGVQGGVVVVTGTDWAGVRAEPSPPMPPREDGETGDGDRGDSENSGDDGDGDDDGDADGDDGGSVTTTTSTTVYDPANPLGTTSSTDGTGAGAGEGTGTTSTTVPPEC